MNKDLIDHSRELIRRFCRNAVLLCSFGKDSMALLHLARETLPRSDLACSTYPLPVLYHRHPWFAFKNKFANRVIESWGLEVHDFPPAACGVKANERHLELVARYHFGNSGMDLPINIESPIARRDFVCGLQWLLRPKSAKIAWLWENALIGHKSTDMDPFDGPIPLKCDHTEAGGVRIAFPLRHWTDADVWDYLEENKVPYDKGRYADAKELADKWANPDYLHACTACIDPRQKALTVHCPKINQQVQNVGANVLRLEQVPAYLEKEQAA
jgi:hypothetical protein